MFVLTKPFEVFDHGSVVWFSNIKVFPAPSKLKLSVKTFKNTCCEDGPYSLRLGSPTGLQLVFIGNFLSVLVIESSKNPSPGLVVLCEYSLATGAPAV